MQGRYDQPKTVGVQMDVSKAPTEEKLFRLFSPLVFGRRFSLAVNSIRR
jgi:hypothetical protein